MRFALAQFGDVDENAFLGSFFSLGRPHDPPQLPPRLQDRAQQSRAPVLSAADIALMVVDLVQVVDNTPFVVAGKPTVAMMEAERRVWR